MGEDKQEKEARGYSRPKSHHGAKKQSGGDYEGWILRLIDKAEDIIHTFALQDWLEFAADKIGKQNHKGITRAQIGALAENRDIAFELPEDLGFRVSKETRYRDARGRWVSEDIGLAMGFKEYPRTVYRGAGNKFISTKTADELVIEEIDLRGARKKKGIVP